MSHIREYDDTNEKSVDDTGKSLSISSSAWPFLTIPVVLTALLTS